MDQVDYTWEVFMLLQNAAAAVVKFTLQSLIQLLVFKSHWGQ